MAVEPCEDGWRDDPTACGDPEHCSPVYPCICNPNGDFEHECDEECYHENARTDAMLEEQLPASKEG